MVPSDTPTSTQSFPSIVHSLFSVSFYPDRYTEIENEITFPLGRSHNSSPRCKVFRVRTRPSLYVFVYRFSSPRLSLGPVPTSNESGPTIVPSGSLFYLSPIENFSTKTTFWPPPNTFFHSLFTEVSIIFLFQFTTFILYLWFWFRFTYSLTVQYVLP